MLPAQGLPASFPGSLFARQGRGNVSGQVAWLESLSPWPAEFGLGRMRALLAELGRPEQEYPAIHVVGTNGKSTVTRRAAAFLEREGMRTGAYTSPHVSGWSSRDFTTNCLSYRILPAGWYCSGTGGAVQHADRDGGPGSA